MTLVIAGLALTALAGFVWRAADRLWHAIAIAALAVVFLPLVAGTPAGDVSRILPAGAFAHGIEGKDQIAMATWPRRSCYRSCWRPACSLRPRRHGGGCAGVSARRRPGANCGFHFSSWMCRLCCGFHSGRKSHL
jgi:hypothetical protein